MNSFRALVEAEIDRFIEAKLTPGPGLLPGREAYSAYLTWHNAQIPEKWPIPPMSETMFGLLMHQRVPHRRTAGTRGYWGVAIV